MARIKRQKKQDKDLAFSMSTKRHAQEVRGLPSMVSASPVAISKLMCCCCGGDDGTCTARVHTVLTSAPKVQLLWLYHGMGTG